MRNFNVNFRHTGPRPVVLKWRQPDGSVVEIRTTVTMPYFGNPLLGTWRCPECGFKIFPRPLRDFVLTGKAKWSGNGWLCPKCGAEMYYDEEA